MVCTVALNNALHMILAFLFLIFKCEYVEALACYESCKILQTHLFQSFPCICNYHNSSVLCKQTLWEHSIVSLCYSRAKCAENLFPYAFIGEHAYTLVPYSWTQHTCDWYRIRKSFALLHLQFRYIHRKQRTPTNSTRQTKYILMAFLI